MWTHFLLLLQQGNIFIVDFELLDGIDANKTDPCTLQFLAAPICLLYKNLVNKMVPIAIQVGPCPSSLGPPSADRARGGSWGGSLKPPGAGAALPASPKEAESSARQVANKHQGFLPGVGSAVHGAGRAPLPKTHLRNSWQGELSAETCPGITHFTPTWAGPQITVSTGARQGKLRHEPDTAPGRQHGAWARSHAGLGAIGGRRVG